MSAGWEIDTEMTDDSAERQRKPGGYIWRARLEDAETLLLDAIVAVDDEAMRAKLRKVLDILRELEHYRGGSTQ